MNNHDKGDLNIALHRYGLKVCWSCSSLKTMDEFCTDKKSSDGISRSCRGCRSADNRRWYKSNRSLARDMADRYKNKNPEKVAAHQELAKALRKETLFRPNVCEICNRECSVEGHHEDYLKPLDVNWLCRTCHNSVHGLSVSKGGGK